MSKKPSIDPLDRAISRILANPEAKPETPDAEIAELLRIARDLRTLPSPVFKASLRTELERNTQMSAKTVVFRAGFRTVTPYLLPPGPEYVDFLKNVFGVEETDGSLTGPGRFNAELRYGESVSIA